MFDQDCGMAHTYYDHGHLSAQQLGILLSACPRLNERTLGFLRAFGGREALQMLDALPGRHALVLAPPRRQARRGSGGGAAPAQQPSSADNHRADAADDNASAGDDDASAGDAVDPLGEEAALLARLLRHRRLAALGVRVDESDKEHSAPSTPPPRGSPPPAARSSTPSAAAARARAPARSSTSS